MKSTSSKKMRNRTSGIVFIIVGLLFASAAGLFLVKDKIHELFVHEKPSSIVTYTDADIPFKFDYPSSWTIKKEKQERENHPTLTIESSKTVALRASNKKSGSQKMTLTYNYGGPIQEGASNPCSSKHSRKDCIKVVNELTSGWLFIEKNSTTWEGRIDETSKIYVQSFTDLETFKTVIESIRK